MKKAIHILTLFFFLQLTAQQTISTAQWQEDLRFIQNTIHNDYSFLFVKTTKQDFDAQVEALYNEIPKLEPHEIKVGFTRLIASFKYGHTGVYFGQKNIGFRSFPFNLFEFENEIYLQGVSKNYQKAVGAKVLKINGMTIEEALEKIAPMVNAENSQFFKAYGINYLGYPAVLHAQGITKTLQNTITLTLEKNGDVFTETFTVMEDGVNVPTHYGYVFQHENWLEARDTSSTPLYLKDLDKMYVSEYLEKEKAMYVRHSAIGNDAAESVKDFYARVFEAVEQKEVEKLIIDLRLNGGGNNYLNKPIITGLIETKKINQTGKLFVIIGKRTYSACQNLVNELDNYTNAIFVGEPTAENINFWGDNRPVKLPNSGIDVSLSYLWWQDKPALENADWKAPSIPVTMSFEAYESNQDPVLEAALTFSNKDFKPNPMQYVTDLYTSGQTQKLAEELPKMIQDPQYAFCDFEIELNKKGNLLLQSGRIPQVHASIQVFSMISQLFPNSALTYKNLGEAYTILGDTAKAREVLQKAISLDNGGKIGKAAKEMLVEIEER
ncbi:S41 family peptidase [Flavobacteriaceae bacterium M23B6Z8]